MLGWDSGTFPLGPALCLAIWVDTSSRGVRNAPVCRNISVLGVGRRGPEALDALLASVRDEGHGLEGGAGAGEAARAGGGEVLVRQLGGDGGRVGVGEDARVRASRGEPAIMFKVSPMATASSCKRTQQSAMMGSTRMYYDTQIGLSRPGAGSEHLFSEGTCLRRSSTPKSSGLQAPVLVRSQQCPL